MRPFRPTAVPPSALRRGAALALALSGLAVASALAFQALALAAATRRRAEARADRAVLRALAGEAAFEAVQRLADDDDLRCDHPREDWTRPRAWTTPEGVAVRTEILDASARFNINNLALTRPGDRAAAHRIVEDLLGVAGHPSATRAAGWLRDAIDTDREGEWEWVETADGRRINSGPNRALLTRAEWSRIPAWEAHAPAPGRETLALLPLLSERPEPVNVNTAPEDTLRALLGPARPALAAGVAALREAAPLHSLDTIAPLVEPLRMSRLRPFLDVRSRWFIVEAEAASPARRILVRATVFRDTDGATRIVRWEEL